MFTKLDASENLTGYTCNKTWQIVGIDEGVGMAVTESVFVNLITGDIGGHQGEWAVRFTHFRFLEPVAYFPNEQQAIQFAETLVGTVPTSKYGKFELLETRLKNKGKLMASKYSGRDINGVEFSAGTKIYYHNGKTLIA